MPILSIWHKTTDNSIVVTSRIVKDKDTWVAECFHQGGFWANPETFVPWHTINSIQTDKEST